MIIKSPSLISFLALATVLSVPANAAYDELGIYLYRFACTTGQGNSADGGTFTASPAENNRVRPHQAAYEAFGIDPTSDAKVVWDMLLRSDYILGKGTTLTRAWDVFENWALNFVTPASGEGRMFYTFYYNSYSGTDFSWSPTLSGGDHDGEEVFGNNNLLAVLDDHYLMFDADGSLSRYNMANGNLITDYSWTTYEDGFFAGQTVADSLKYMIGAEDGYLFFLDGENTIIQYQLGTSSATHRSTFTYEMTDELAEYTLRQVIDGEAPGYTYMGWDVGAIILGTQIQAVPEPSAALLALSALSAASFRRTRRR